MMNKIMDAFKRILKSRSLKYGSNSIILIAVVVAIAVVVNMLVGIKPLKWDLTPNKLFTIGDTTKEILKGLNKDVTIYGLYDGGKINDNPDLKEVNELLGQYTKYNHIKLEYVDPDKDPAILTKIDPNSTKDIKSTDFVIKSGNKLKVIENYDLYDTQFDQQSYQTYKTGLQAEQQFTGAIKYVTSATTPVIYFTEGHEEAKTDTDFKTLKSYIERNNFEVKTVNLITSAKVPDDCSVLIVASPKKDMTNDEKEKISEYLTKNGGNAIFMFDPLDSNTQFPTFEALLKNYNIGLNYDRVKENDTQRFVPQKPNDLVPVLQNSGFTPGLDPSSFGMIVSKTRSLNILKNQKDYLTVSSLLKTSTKAVGEQIDKAKGSDIPGPLDVGIAVEDKGQLKMSKVIVYGSTSFINENVIQQYGPYGIALFLTNINWMSNVQDDMVIAPKSYSTAKLDMNAAQVNVVSLFVVIVLPILILGLGTFVWMRRRHL